jgi:hypothetical protein
MMSSRQDKIDAIKNAWRYIEDVYGVGELMLEVRGGTYIKLCNDNPQQFLFVYHNVARASQAYTHIESWLMDVSTEDIDAIDAIVSMTSNHYIEKCRETTGLSVKRRHSEEAPSNKRPRRSRQ